MPSAIPKPKPATAQQKRFARYYIISLNATDAAKKAGYSARSASELGYSLLQNPSVQREIDKLARDRNRRLDLKADRVVRSALEVMDIDIADVFNSDGTLRAVHDMPEHARRAVASVEVDEITTGQGENRRVIGHTSKIKFWDKLTATKLLMQHLGLLKEIHEHHVKSDIVGALREGRRRAGKTAKRATKRKPKES